MIKIELHDEQRAKIEELFLKDLVGDPSGSKRRGRLIKRLDEKECRELLQDKSKPELKPLCRYLYDRTGKPNAANVKALLLADRKHMESFMQQFGTYSKEITDDLLRIVFRYTNFSNRKVVSEILHEMKMPVCPYCNRLYITALRKKKVRPQLDHFFPKSKYPYLALSLYNLIPSCSVCNQAKSDLDSRRKPLLYPYEEEFGENVVFALELTGEDDFVKKITGCDPEISVRIHNLFPTSDLGKKADRQDAQLHLTELYNEHRDYVADILKNYYINTDARMEELLQQFPNIFRSKDEIRSLVFMSAISKDQWGKRPLSKLTYDILQELNNLMR